MYRARRSDGNAEIATRLPTPCIRQDRNSPIVRGGCYTVPAGNMWTTRRTFLGAALAAPAVFGAPNKRLKIGVTDWNLRMSGNVEALALARKIGFEGVEVSLGRKPGGDKLPLDDAGVQKAYLDASKQHKVALAGTCLDILHVNYLKNDKLGQKWVADGIRITRLLNARVMLLPFFGKGALTTPQEMDYVGDALRELAPEAEKAKVDRKSV